MTPWHFLRIDRVSKSFRQDGTRVAVVDDVSMTIEEGEFVVFLGPSGCGKTTLLRIVGGLETPSSGRVVLEGEEVRGPDRKKGMVFQSYGALPWLSVLDNVRFGTRFRDDLTPAKKEQVARHYLSLVGLEGYESFQTNRISGGMRQRLAIARTLAAGPDILLMDEPFGALDAYNREFLQVQLRALQQREKKTVIFVTHEVEEAIFLADRIFVFSARPARIVTAFSVADHLSGERTLEMRESEAFFRFRNTVLTVARAQAQRMEALTLETAA